MPRALYARLYSLSALKCRYTDARLTPSARAIAVGLSPRARRAFAAASLSASITVGRPPLRPWAFAAARPAMWCSPRKAQPRQQAEADVEEARAAAAVEMDEKLQAVTNSDDGRPIHQAHCPFRAYLVCPRLWVLCVETSAPAGA